MQHRLLWTIGLFIPLLLGAATLVPVEKAKVEGSLCVYDLTLLPIEGRGWTDTPGPYDRLPAKAQSKVRPPVWSLSRHSAGIGARFVTDATELTVNWVLTSASLDMPHMPATGVSGVDLYVRQPSGTWRWVANGRPQGQTNSARLYRGLASRSREFFLYLPLYNGVSEVELAIPAEATLALAPKRPATRQKPILFYGTSITQGGCASRPGMVHTAMIGRAFDWPVINLGFSGNGKMEPEMAELLAEIDPAVYVLDCLPNMNGTMVTERVKPFVARLRRSHPHTPILLVEDRTYANAFMMPERGARNRENREAMQAVFSELQAEGVPQLHYLPGARLLGADGEDTVDGSHPTDLGFARQTEAFLKVLRPILDGRMQSQP